MTATDLHNEEKKKILKGLEMVQKKLLEFKKMKNSKLVIWQNNKIVSIKP
jgi:molecular chaperone GrpE (heat shock protein)